MNDTLLIDSEAGMLRLGRQLAALLLPGAVIYLRGELGAGKTTLVRGCLRGFGYAGLVKSPTYTLVENYKVRQQEVLHFDLYRIKSAQELINVGIHDYFSDAVISFIEWPENGFSQLPAATLCCDIKHQQHQRVVNFFAEQAQAVEIIRKLVEQNK